MHVLEAQNLNTIFTKGPFFPLKRVSKDSFHTIQRKQVYVNPLLHEHFVKKKINEKSPVTSSNCYKTIKKTASILIKLGTNVEPLPL
jgi:hypothetical protein